MYRTSEIWKTGDNIFNPFTDPIRELSALGRQLDKMLEGFICSDEEYEDCIPVTDTSFLCENVREDSSGSESLRYAEV